jgi:SAM-dependent methyltransferase
LSSDDPRHDDSGKYKTRIKSDMASAESYTHRKQSKHDAEMQLIRRALSHVNDVHTFLDIPCGAGRASILLARAGYNTTGADLGEAVSSVAAAKVEEAGVPVVIEQADLESMTYEDSSFDAILCFRLYHHFPDDEVRERAISELCRVANKYVLISYLSPNSFTSIKRLVRERSGNKPSRQNATSLKSIEKYFNQRGFALVKDVPQFWFIHTLHLAVFKRRDF